MSAPQLVFRQYIDAYNARNVSAMLACFDEGCLFENVSGGKLTVRTQGKAELETLARKSADAIESRQQTVISLTEGQGRLVAEIDYHAKLRTDLSAEIRAGCEVRLRGVSVLEFANGQIVRLTDYS